MTHHVHLEPQCGHHDWEHSPWSWRAMCSHFTLGALVWNAGSTDSALGTLRANEARWRTKDRREKKKVRCSFTTQVLLLFSGVLLRAFAGDKSFFCCLSCSSFLRGAIWQRLIFCNYVLLILGIIITQGGFPGGPSIMNLSAIAGGIRDAGSFPGSGRFPGRGYGNPLQHSCLENPMDSKV